MRTISVLDILEETASCYGARTAVIDGGTEVTYEQLAERAKRLGCALTEELDEAVQKPVMLFMDTGQVWIKNGSRPCALHPPRWKAPCAGVPPSGRS